MYIEYWKKRYMCWLCLFGLMFCLFDSAQAETVIQTITVQSADATLVGALLLPPGNGPFPAVIVVHGSAPNERQAYMNYAQRVFVAQGIAVLLYDKRSYGESSGQRDATTLPQLAQDVEAWATLLRGYPVINAEQIGLVGDSQAGWIIALALQAAPDLAFGVMISPSAVSPAQQALYHSYQSTYNRSDSAALALHALRGRVVYNTYLQTFDAGGISQNLDFDVLPVISALKQPILLIFGTADEVVPAVQSADMFKQALSDHPDVTIVFYPEADHGIQILQADGVRAFAPAYHQQLTNWILQHTRSASSEAGLVLINDTPLSEQQAAIQVRILSPIPWVATLFGVGLLLLIWILLFVLSGVMLRGKVLASLPRFDRRCLGLMNGLFLLLVPATFIHAILAAEQVSSFVAFMLIRSLWVMTLVLACVALIKLLYNLRFVRNHISGFMWVLFVGNYVFVLIGLGFLTYWLVLFV